MANHTVLLIFTIAGTISFMVYAAFVAAVYLRFIFKKQKDLPYNHEPLSIIVAARNEAENLAKNLPHVLAQNRDNFEVIVVNDGSTDDTAHILDGLAKKHSHLRIIHAAPQGKKKALHVAIKAAKYDILLFTDADCSPATKNWAAEMASYFTQGVEIVLGYGAYEQKKGLLNLLIQMDTAIIAARYGGMALAGVPYMGVGRNLAYRKSLWEKNNGFASHEDLPYGDDDLFVAEAANTRNTAVCIHPNSFTYSAPPITFSDWKNQKVRHLSAGKRYSGYISTLLFAEVLSELTFWTSGIILCLLGLSVWFMFLLTFYVIFKTFVLNSLYKVLGARSTYIFAPILNLLLLFALFLFGINAIFARQVAWKKQE